MVLSRRTPRLGLALGSGSARGWAHIGVLQVLQEEGLKPDVVCGASIGALVGAAYAGGELERFADWVQGLGMRDVFGFMDFNLAGWPWCRTRRRSSPARCPSPNRPPAPTG